MEEYLTGGACLGCYPPGLFQHVLFSTRPVTTGFLMAEAAKVAALFPTVLWMLSVAHTLSPYCRRFCSSACAQIGTPGHSVHPVINKGEREKELLPWALMFHSVRCSVAPPKRLLLLPNARAQPCHFFVMLHVTIGYPPTGLVGSRRCARLPASIRKTKLDRIPRTPSLTSTER